MMGPNMIKGYLRLWPFVRPYKKSFISIIILALALAVMTPQIAALAMLLIDTLNSLDFLNAPQYEKVIEFFSGIFGEQAVREFFSDRSRILKTVGLAFPIYYLIFGTLRYFYYFTVRYLEERVTNEIRYQIMDRLMRLSPSFYMQNTSGSGGLLSRTLNDTMTIQSGLQFYTDLLREPIIALALIVQMFRVNWKISLFCIVFLPLFSLLIRKMTKALKSLSNRGMNALEGVTRNLKEGLDGMRVIQSFNLENHMRQRFRESIDNYNYIRRKTIKRMELTSPLNEFMASLLMGSLAVWVGYMITDGQMQLSEFIGFIALAGALNQPMKKVQQALVQIIPTRVAIERVLEVIESTQSVKEPIVPQSIPNWKTIEFRNVSFSYGGEKVLKNINLTVQRGEVIALVGESGSGKSTLVNLLERFFDPTEGEIFFDNISISDFSVKELRDQIALVTQDVFLFDASLEDNIRAGDHSKSFAQVQEAAEKANAAKFIERLPAKYAAAAGEKGANFSGGEKQRLSIARAIYKDAPILILDEATSALDSASEAEVQKGIQSLMQGRTAFLIAHRLSTVSSAHRILVMNKGEIVEQGTHQELLNQSGLYKHYHSLQVQMNKES